MFDLAPPIPDRTATLGRWAARASSNWWFLQFPAIGLGLVMRFPRVAREPWAGGVRSAAWRARGRSSRYRPEWAQGGLGRPPGFRLRDRNKGGVVRLLSSGTRSSQKKSKRAQMVVSRFRSLLNQFPALKNRNSRDSLPATKPVETPCVKKIALRDLCQRFRSLRSLFTPDLDA